MAKDYKPYWQEKNRCWCCNCGEISEATGRRKPVYFRDIPFGKPGTANYRKVQAAVDALVASRPVAVVHSSEPTFGWLGRRYLDWLEKRVHSGRAKPLTYKGHKQALAKFAESAYSTGKTFDGILARDLTATHMARFIEGMVKADRGPDRATGYGPNYISRIVASVQTVMNWAAEPRADREPGDPERLIDLNPIKGFTHEATKAPHSPDRYLGENQVRKFFEWGYGRAEAYVRVGKRANRKGEPILKGGDLERWFERLTIDLIRVAYLTGTRPGELRVAEWTDFEPKVEKVDGIDDWCGRITLDPTRWKSGGKTGRTREIILVPEAVKVIEEIRANPNHHPRFIWTHRRGPNSEDRGAITRAHGEPWNESSLPNKVATLRKLAIADGVKLDDVGPNRFVMYMLRHTRAAELLMQGVPIATVAQLLGTSVQMIQTVYGSFLTSHLAEAITRGLPRVVRPEAQPSQ